MLYKSMNIKNNKINLDINNNKLLKNNISLLGVFTLLKIIKYK